MPAPTTVLMPIYEGVTQLDFTVRTALGDFEFATGRGERVGWGRLTLGHQRVASISPTSTGLVAFGLKHMTIAKRPRGLNTCSLIWSRKVFAR